MPIGEIADKCYGRGVRSPFAEHPCAVGIAVKSEIIVSVGEFVERAAFSGEFLQFPDHVLMTALDGVGMRLEPGVIFDQGET